MTDEKTSLLLQGFAVLFRHQAKLHLIFSQEELNVEHENDGDAQTRLHSQFFRLPARQMIEDGWPENRIMLGGFHDLFAQMESLFRGLDSSFDEPRRPSTFSSLLPGVFGGWFGAPQTPPPLDERRRGLQVKVEEI